ncbi:hypothetical protein [Pseudomonas sp. C2B4]|uniref:hypothetical protein n=1 Tax=Pseudomonas sp. C2B4 TaxID=2735270 RepID=UPI0015862218|nr:hypothetical protein [Pseudomonas sp. C2B4]NUU37296.1 hypothetical protein [Pseudomonas sp. C2B4]
MDLIKTVATACLRWATCFQTCLLRFLKQLFRSALFNPGKATSSVNAPGDLLTAVEAVCERLAADEGWHALLLRHGLDLKARPLAAELEKTLAVDRNVKGFEDFSWNGQRGIEPRSPARSLLFHALASPNVTTDPVGNLLQLFPSAAEIETVLDYVYGVQPPSLEDLQALAGGAPLAIVVFAAEYRPGPDTGHKKHADMCFSRTGIARVGTAPARYDPARRGFLPWKEDDPQAICVTPARYYSYIAMEKTGDTPGFGPWPVQPGDENLKIWVPLHKLFDGPECIADMDLKVDKEVYQLNEKLRKFHIRFPLSTIGQPDLSKPPFVITENLVDWANEQIYGQGLLMPVPKPRLVEEAIYEDEKLFFRIPKGQHFAGFIINRRYKRRRDGSIEDLNEHPDVVEIVEGGGYNALHFIDFTAEGWVIAYCQQLAATMKSVAAYSLVAAPDFYPEYTQRRLLEWINRHQFPADFLPTTFRVLADRRVAGNPELPGQHFMLDDTSITAIITHPLGETEQPDAVTVAHAQRQTSLPDAATGTFSPGWEVSYPSDQGFDPKSLCAFELGSPFLEDVRICASIGGFWAAVSPDNSRAFAPKRDWISIIPLTDEELGNWDGTDGPRPITDDDGKRLVEYTNFDFTDLTKNTLTDLLHLHYLAQTTAEDFEARILSMHRAYLALGLSSREEKKEWPVLSFRKVEHPDADLEQAESETGFVLPAPVHGYQIYKTDICLTTPSHHDFTKLHAVVIEMVHLFVGPTALLIKREQGPWQVRYFVQP